VLLGRPWQYDTNVVYNDRENKFTFEKEGRRHTHIPLKDKIPEEQINTKVLLVTEKEFLKRVQDEDVSFVVVRKPRVVLTNTRIYDFPIEVQKLLEEYVDIVVDDFQ